MSIEDFGQHFIKKISDVFMSVLFKAGCQSALLKLLFIDSELYVM